MLYSAEIKYGMDEGLFGTNATYKTVAHPTIVGLEEEVNNHLIKQKKLTPVSNKFIRADIDVYHTVRELPFTEDPYPVDKSPNLLRYEFAYSPIKEGDKFLVRTIYKHKTIQFFTMVGSDLYHNLEKYMDSRELLNIFQLEFDDTCRLWGSELANLHSLIVPYEENRVKLSYNDIC